MVFNGDSDARRMLILRAVLNAEVATSLFKVGLIGYAVLCGMPTVEPVAALSRVFGTNLMTMDIGALFGRVTVRFRRHHPRLYLHRPPTSRPTADRPFRCGANYPFDACFHDLFVFQIPLGVTGIAFLAGLVTARRDRFKLILICVLGIIIAVCLPALSTLYELRFSVNVAGNSDLIRTEQITALDAFFKDAPILGHGLGSYTTQVVRAEDSEDGIRYSYEAQLLALARQVGIVGIGLLLALGAYYYSDLWYKPWSRFRDRGAIAILLLFWIGAGLYNPLLFHPVAGINYAVMAALAAVADRPKADMAEQQILLA